MGKHSLPLTSTSLQTNPGPGNNVNSLHTLEPWFSNILLLPRWLSGKESFCNAGDPSSIPGSGRSPGEERGCLLQYSRASLVAQMVKDSPAIWETWVGSLGLEDPWRREWLPTIFLPGEFHGQRRLAGYSPWGCKELDTTEQLTCHSSAK